MKRIALLGLLLLLSSGCGRGWLPTLRGAACRGGCLTAAPAPLAANTGCADCANGYGAAYNNYDSGEIIGNTVIGDTGYYGSAIDGYNGAIVDGQIIGSGTMVAPSITPSN